MQCAVDVGGFDYYQILQGRDYPIANNNAISDFLEAHRGKDFINAVCEENSFSNKDRHKYALYWRLGPTANPLFLMEKIISKLSYKIVLRSHFLLPVPRIVDGDSKLLIYRGWAHFCLSDRTTKYVLEYNRNHPKIRRFFEHVYAADESFFHTIIFNNEELVKNTITGRVLNESERCLKAMLNLTYFEYPHYVRVFKDISEWPILRDSGYLYFRKVSSSNSELLDYIDALHGRNG